MIDFGNHYCVAQIGVLSLGTCCPPREQPLLISCSPIPHHVIPEGSLGEHGRNFWRGAGILRNVSIKTYKKCEISCGFHAFFIFAPNRLHSAILKLTFILFVCIITS